MGIYTANRRWLYCHAFKIATAVFSTVAIFTFLFDWTKVFSSIGGLCRILIGCGIFIGLYSLVLVGHLVYLAKVKERTIYTDRVGHTVKMRFGDLLSQSTSIEGQPIQSIVIPVNRCFDCIVDDKLIASSSLHGQVLSRIYKKRIFSPESLHLEIQERLSGCEYAELTRDQKPAGNLRRYSVGTTALICCDRQRYFLLGLSSFDKNLKASMSKNDYTIAIQKLFEFCDSNAQGGQVFMPVIGTGLSRAIKDKNNAIKYLVNTVILNDELLSYDLVLVVPEKERNNIYHTNI